MTENELKSMTVVQLRKVARDAGVVLGAGIDKAGIIAKILEHGVSSAPAAAPAAPAPEPASSEPKFQAAWHNSDAPRYNSRPAYQYNPAPARPAWQNTTPAGNPMSREQQRVQPVRPGTFTPRFGPAASAPASPAQESAAPAETPHTPAASPLPERRIGESSGYTHRISAVYTPAYTAPSHTAPAESFAPPAQDTAAPALTLEELLASGEYEEGGGVLELHPDGYGFLRAPGFLPSTKDVYVSMAQIRRFGLRTGDKIEGKIRPQREGDKYAALLYISSVNGVPEEEAFSRPLFDELTPVYPTRKISLESADGKSMKDMRLIDLIAPIGFGQRGLMLCPPGTGKNELMQHFAQIICQNYPEAHVLMLLVDINPEDATLMRDSVPCTVLSSSFDQAPEVHLRLSEIVLERAMRLVEQKKDVVLLVDSLTRLAKIYTTAAAQQGRSLPGMVNPASLFRAKRMFGAARACKEGGSLTVIAAMDILTGSKVDDSVVEEFKGTANMELTLDLNVARAGIRPALNLQNSYTKNSDQLLNDRQKEGLTLIRTLLGNSSSAVAIPQLESMMDKAETNDELLLKMKSWFALMNR
ncbi:MAG: transcription termination factor Rho [Clostridiales bacterium]|nr:transcription termination factor Rho [Clostridiales bacterium]